jgi:hypothetical protein
MHPTRLWHRTLAGLGLILLSLAGPALATSDGVPGQLSADQAARDLRVLERALDELHPGLYRYQTAEGLAAQFARARAALSTGADIGQMVLWVTRIGASLRCGHTLTNPLNQSPAVQAYLAALPGLPVQVSAYGRRWLVVASADPAIRRHDEILSVENVPVSALVDRLLPYLRADGSSDGKRLAQLGHDSHGGVLDRLLPLLLPPVDGHYRLRLKAADGRVRSVRVAAQAPTLRDRTLQQSGFVAEDLSWRMVIRGEVAIMTLPTFAFWNSDFDGQAWLRESFARLAGTSVRHLVLDLRQNEGGDSALVHALLGHLLEEPYQPPAGRRVSAYERVPYVLARFLDTWDFGFFDRTGQVRRGDGREWLLLDQSAPEPVQPREPHFAGRVVALTGPRMSSAGFLIARELKATGRATLVGEPTGGNRRGLNGGQLAWLTLPESGVALDIPLIATIHDGEPDAPILPDIPMSPTPEDAIAGIDRALQRAISLARRP